MGPSKFGKWEVRGREGEECQGLETAHVRVQRVRISPSPLMLRPSRAPLPCHPVTPSHLYALSPSHPCNTSTFTPTHPQTTDPLSL